MKDFKEMLKEGLKITSKTKVNEKPEYQMLETERKKHWAPIILYDKFKKE